jgi:hypothetical protein
MKNERICGLGLALMAVCVCVCYSQDLARRNILVTTSNGEYQAKVTGTTLRGGEACNSDVRTPPVNED